MSGTAFHFEANALRLGFSMFRDPNHKLPDGIDPSVVRATLNYLKWFKARTEWFSDSLDYTAMQAMVDRLRDHLETQAVRADIKDRDWLIATLPDRGLISNWYTKYTMFDPTMGMYDPTEAENYFRQRMIKRFNVLAEFIDSRVLRKRK